MNKIKTYLNNHAKTFMSKYVYSYFLIFLIPFLLVSTIWYRTSLKSISQQIDATMDSYLLQVDNSWVNQLSQLENLAAQISQDYKLSSYMVNHSYYSKEAKEELVRYKLNSQLVDDVYLYFYNTPNQFYSSVGYLSLDTFARQRYSNYNIPLESIKQDLHQQVPKISPIYKKNSPSPMEELGFLVYYVPLVNSEGTNYGSVMYKLNLQGIQKKLTPLIEHQNGNVFIVNKEGKILANVNDSLLTTHPLKSQQLMDISKRDKITLNKQKYLVSRAQNKLYGLTYITLMDAKQAYHPIKKMHYWMMLGLLIVFVIGTIVATYLGRRHYKPIQQLEAAIQQQMGAVQETDSLDDFDRIEQQLSQFFEQNQQLLEEIKRQTPYAREQVLRRLLNGKLNHTKQLDILLESVAIQFYEESFFVILIDTHMMNKKVTIQNQAFLMEVLSELEGTSYRAYGTELLTSPAIALLVSTNKPVVPVQMVKIIQEILTYMEKEQSIIPNICVGNPVTELTEINRSYIEALAVLDYQAMHGQAEEIIFYTDLDQQGYTQQFNYPTNEQLKLVQSLNQGDLHIARESINHLIQYGIKYQQSVNGLRLYGYYLLNTVLKTGMDLCGDDFFIEGEQQAEFQSMEDLRRRLVTLVEKICLVVSNKPKNQESALKEEIFTYIDQYYASHDLSLDSLAEHLDVSISYLSRFIKKESGLTFSKYVQQLRLERIKEALVETDLPIKDIIQSSGYYDVSNYTRKFKTLVGVTPGQYRLLQRYEEG